MAGNVATGHRLTTSQAGLDADGRVPRGLLRRSQWLAGVTPKLGSRNRHSELTQPRHSSRHRSSRDSKRPEAAAAALRTLYPAFKAHKRGTLRVSHLHTIAYEVHGTPHGQPVLCVHGGPGAGAYAKHAQFFDPKHWRVVLVDQRGCGASTPRGCLQDNTTQALISDFELLRRHLEIDTWLLFGGSWGTALSLAYAHAHTDRVDGLILRAICLMSRAEIDWMFGGGVAALQPKAWDDFLAPLPESERTDPQAAYYQRLVSSDAAIRNAAAAAWLQFDMAAGRIPSQQLQSWSGDAWSQADAGTGPAHRLPPLKRVAGGPGSNSSSCANGSGANGSGGAVTAADGKAASPPWALQPGFGAGGSTAAAAQHADGGSKPAASPAAAAGGSTGSGGANAPGAAASTEDASSNGGGSTAGSSSGSSSSGGNASGGAFAAPLPSGDGGMSAFTAQAMLEAHYCVNSAFLLEQPILQNVERLRGIPAIGIQGRLDLVCPPVTAYQLHKAWPELRLRLVGGAGHSQYDPAITHELLEATDAMRDKTRVQLRQPQMEVAVY